MNTTKDKYTLDLLVLAYKQNDSLTESLKEVDVDGYYNFYNGNSPLLSLKREAPLGKYQYVYTIYVCDWVVGNENTSPYDDTLASFIAGDKAMNAYGEILNTEWKTLGRLYFGTFIPFLQDIYLRIDNEALYTPDCLANLYGAESILGLDLINVKEVDIAFDTEINIPYRFMRYYRNHEDFDLILNNRNIAPNEDVDALLHIKKGSRANPFKIHSFDISNAEGTLSLRCYNKRNELLNSQKDYISSAVETWRAVYRLEVSLKNQKEVRKCIQALIPKEDTNTYLQNIQKYKDFRMSLGVDEEELDNQINLSIANAPSIKQRVFLETLMNNLNNEDLLSRLHEDALYRLIHFKNKRNRDLYHLIPLLYCKLSKK